MSDPFAIPNDRPIEHICSNGNTFKCERADLKGKIIVIRENSPNKKMKPEDRTRDIERLLNDMAEFIGWHALVVWPGLNGFAGYDTLHFEYV